MATDTGSGRYRWCLRLLSISQEDKHMLESDYNGGDLKPMNKKSAFIFLSIIAFGAFVGWLVASSMHPSIKTVLPPTPVVSKGERFSASYLYMSREERIDAARAIFTGRVVSISPTEWNQNSGEAWAIDPEDSNPNSPAALMIHTITIAVDQPIVDTINLGKEITITVIGNSPVDGPTDDGLQVGDSAVFFVQERVLAWREGGMQKKLMFVNAPQDSHLVSQADGLYHTWKDEQPPLSFNDLIKEIAQRRKVLIQP